MKVYQSQDDTWIFSDGVTKHTGLTEAEARIMSDKLTALTKMQTIINALAEIEGLLEYNNANKYGQGQDHAITDADAAMLKGNVAAADAFNGFNCLTHVRKLLVGDTEDPPTLEDYTGIIDLLRKLDA
jgi:hypothetical protein